MFHRKLLHKGASSTDEYLSEGTRLPLFSNFCYAAKVHFNSEKHVRLATVYQLKSVSGAYVSSLSPDISFRIHHKKCTRNLRILRL